MSKHLIAGPHNPISQPQVAYAADGGSISVDLRWLWLAIVKHQLLIALCACVAVFPTVVYIRFAKPVYRATVTLQISPEPTKVLPYTNVSDSWANPLPYFDIYMKSQDEILRGASLRQRTLDRLRKEFGRPGETRLEDDLAQLPEILRVEGSQMLHISSVAHDPSLAAAIANTWAEEFIKLHQERAHRANQEATEFLQGQLQELKQKVEKVEVELVEYARTHDILSLDSKQENVVRSRFGYLSMELARAEKNLITARAERDALSGVSLDALPESLKDPLLVSLETRVLQVEQDLARLLAQFDENWPAVAQKRQELALLRTQLSEARRKNLAGAKKQADIKYGSAQSEWQMFQSAFTKQATIVNTLNGASVEYDILKRDFETSEQLYHALLQRLKETGVSAGLEFGNITIGDRARPNSEPYRPRKALSLLLALSLGLTLGLGLSVAIEALANKVTDPWDVEQYGVPLLGWVPKFAPHNGNHISPDTGILSRLIQAADTLGPPSDSVQTLTKSECQARECYRTLCASILLSRAGAPPRTLLISSAVPKEGKTTTTLSLGGTLASIGSPTLVVDADFRNASLSRMCGVGSREEGLSTYLAGGNLLIRETSIPNLHLLSCGPMPPNSVALLHSNRMRELLNMPGDRFRFILVDCPPVLSLVDASVLAAQVQGVVLVVRCDETPKDILRKTVLQLERTGAHLLGAAVNQVDLRSPEYSEYSKYYYTYAAGRDASC